MSDSTYAGTLPGDFAITADGGARYSVSLPLPPGTAGLAPELALVYTSTGGNGPLGIGWQLQGLSTVTRIGGVPARDGFRGSVTYTDRDRFSLDGNRLMAVAGAYGAPDAVYHTEMESWRKIVPVYGATPGRQGPDAFTVYEPDGRRLDYGSTADSQVVAAAEVPHIRVWALSRATDRHGNYYELHYAQHGGSYYLTAVDYTGTAIDGPKRRVELDYEARPDAFTHWVAGYPVATDRRLARVRVSVGGRAVYRFELAYEQALVTGRSRLVSLSQLDTQGRALSPTRFLWQEGEPRLLRPQPVVTQTGASFGGNFLPVDVDGDGRLDFINAYPRDQRLAIDVYLADEAGTGYTGPTAVEVPRLPVGGSLLPMDVNADGCTDLVHVGRNGSELGLTVFLATRDASRGWGYAAGPVFGGVSGVPVGGSVHPADVDGNGAVDLIYLLRSASTLDFRVLKSTGASFEEASIVRTTLPPGGQCIPLDLDGDGMMDVVYAYRQEGALQLALLQSDGDALTLKTPAALPPRCGLSPTGALMPMDVNGDGLADLVHAGRTVEGGLVVTRLINTGAGFQVQPSQTFPDIPSTAALLPADLTGSGTSDLVVATRGTADVPGTAVRALLATDPGFVRADIGQPLAGRSWSPSILPLDVSGVGKAGLVQFGRANGKLALASVLPAGAMPDLLTSIANGIGGEISVRYAPMTDRSVYTQSSSPVHTRGLFNGGAAGAAFALSDAGEASASPGAVAPVMKALYPKYLVASYTKADGRGARYEYRHTYSDALLDFGGGRGWIGFAAQTSVDADLGTTTVTTYRQDFPFTSAAASSVISRTSDGAPLSGTAFRYTSGTPYPGVYQTLVAERTGTSYTDGRADGVATTRTEYDPFGNPTRVSETTNGHGAPLYMHATYVNDESSWLIGLRTERMQTADAAGTAVLARERTVYDAATGQPTARRVWHDQQQRWLESRLSYDRFGNLIADTDAGGATREAAYDDVYHTFIATMTLPRAGNGPRLTTRYEHDPAFGEVIALTDENGVTRRTVLDGLGRVAERRGPLPDGTPGALLVQSRGHDALGYYDESRARLDWAGTQWAVRRQYIDGLDRTFRTVTTAADGMRRTVVERAFNSKNLLLRETLPHFDGERGEAITHTYDASGHLAQTTQPGGSGPTITTYAYPDSSTCVVTEAAGTPLARTTTTVNGTFNGETLPVRIVDALGAETRIQCDALGRATEMVDPAGTTTATAFDTLGNATSVVVTNGARTIRRETAAYDAVARTVTRTDARGARMRYVHDALGRVTRMEDGDGRVTQLAYDDAAAGGMNRVCAVSLPDGDGYQFAYDAYGHQRTIDVQLAGRRFAFEREFLPSGHLALVRHPDGSEQRYAFTPGGMPAGSALSAGGATRASVVFEEYNAAGKPGRVRYGNGVAEELTYNAAGQLASQSVAAADGSALLRHGFRWNEVDTLAAIDDGLQPARSHGFTYDRVGRLTTATGPYATPQRFQYDLAGNLLEKSGGTMRYDGGLLVSAPGVSLGYDAGGNTTSIAGSDRSTTLAYDAEGRLISAGDCTFTYDHTGRRLAKTSQGTITLYPAPDYEVTIADGREEHAVNLGGPMGLVATVSKDGAAACYYHRSQVNSTGLVTDGAGRRLARVDYLPFGEISAFEGPDVFRYKFAGRELDEETGLYNFGARYYDPRLGRFISSDTELGASLGRSDALNGYAYVLNSPVTLVDPTGHSVWEAIGEGFKNFGNSFAYGMTVVGEGIAYGASTSANYLQQTASVWAPYVISGLLIVGGVALIVASGGMATPLLVAAVSIAGSTLLGAGIGGMVYAATHRGDEFSWRHWGVQVGIGAAAGFVGGAIGQGANVAAQGMMNAGWVSFSAGAAGKIAFMAVVGAAEGALIGAGTTILTNLDEGRTWNEGAGYASVVGAGTGFAAGGLSGAAEGGWTRALNEEEVGRVSKTVSKESVARMRVFDKAGAGATGKLLIKAPKYAMKAGGGAFMQYGPEFSW